MFEPLLPDTDDPFRRVASAGNLEWQQQGLCKAYPVSLFFPEPRESTRQAKSICRRCPVAEQCLTFAMDNHIEHGIWGGLSSRQRRQLRRDARAA